MRRFSRSQSENHRRRQWHCKPILLGLGGVLLTGGAGFGLIWIYLHERLTPLIEQNLSQALDRPVKMGRIESISLTGLKFGESIVPPTEDNYNWMTINAIDVHFNLWTVLLQRKLNLSLLLDQPVVNISQHPEQGWAVFSFQSEESTGNIQTDIDQVQIQNGTVVLHPLNRRSLFAIHHLQGETTFREGTQWADLQLVGRLAEHGRFRLTGSTTDDGSAMRFAFRGYELPLNQFNALLPLEMTLTGGLAEVELDLQRQVNQPLSLNGTAQVEAGALKLAASPIPLTALNSRLQFAGEQIHFQNTEFRVGAIPARLGGTVHLRDGFQLTAQIPPVSTQALQTTLNTSLPVQGEWQVDAKMTGPLMQPQITGQVFNTKPVTVDRVRFKAISAQLTATPETVVLQDLQIVPVMGGRMVGQGKLDLNGTYPLMFKAQGSVPMDAIAHTYHLPIPANTPLGSITVNAQLSGTAQRPQAIAQWRLTGGAYPGQGEVGFAEGVLRLRNTRLQVGKGQLRGNAIARFATGQWQATLSSSHLEMTRLTTPLRGLLDGTLELAGPLNHWSPQTLQAKGQLRLSEGLPLMPGALTAAFRWRGNGLEIQQLTAPGIQANGMLTAQAATWNQIAWTGVDVNVRMRQYDLSIAKTLLPFPAFLDVAGRADFEGRLTGTLTNLNLAGQLGLHQLAFNDLTFEPLKGRIHFATQSGLAVDLQGQRDRITLVLDRHYRPNQINLEVDQARVLGKMEGDRLTTQVADFPLQSLRFAPAAGWGIGNLSGNLSGQLTANLKDLSNPQLAGNVRIDHPALGHLNAAPHPQHEGDRWVASFRANNGTLTLTDSTLTLGNSLYRLQGSLTPGQNPHLAGQLVAERGNIGDLLVALQWFELEDMGRLSAPAWFAPRTAQAEQLQPLSPQPGSSSASLLSQLQQFADITAQMEPASGLTNLSALQGQFSGRFTVQGSAQSGFVGAIDLQGQNWIWGDDGIQQVSLSGQLAGDTLTLNDATLQGLVIGDGTGASQHFDTRLTLSGDFTPRQFSGALQVNQAPIALINRWMPLPTEVKGTLNAAATLSGTLSDPQMQGEFVVGNGQVGGVDLDDVQGTFAYEDARLHLEGELLTEEPGHLVGKADIPYVLPFATVLPASDRMDVVLDVRDDGLSLLNRFTGGQLNWESGQAEVDLQITGTLQSPQIQGTGSFHQASFTTAALSSPITDLNGQILVTGDRLTIPALHGRFGGGELRAQGALPLFDAASVPAAEALLTLALDDVTLNFGEMYQGKVNGEMQITGYAFSPILTGTIQLSDGQLLLQPPPESPPFPIPMQFNELRLTLGDRFHLRRPPVLDIATTGDIRFSGDLSNPLPDGTVYLQSGRVNLFGSRFRLSQSQENTARFVPTHGFDPLLDVQLVAYIPGIQRRFARYASADPNSEIEITEPTIPGSGHVQSILVETRFQGFTSALVRNPNTVILRSVPPLTRTEIVELLGGGTATAFLEDEGLLMLGNAADAALLTTPELWVEDTFNLEEFNLFPVGIIEDGEVVDQELALETSVNLTHNLIASVQYVLTSEDMPEFIFRYRLNNNVRVRAFTDLGDNTGVLLQFNSEF